MSNSNGFRLILSGIFAGVGIGLLLGIIMGLSVSPVVLTVMGALTGLLGAVLGLENKIGNSEDNQASDIAKNIKVGAFGFAVIAGIFFGMNVRTHSKIGPTISERIDKWEKAGYDPEVAKRYVAYELLSIDPKTGSATVLTGEVQKGTQAVLFNSEQTLELAAVMDTTLFGGKIKYAMEELGKFENPDLDKLLATVATDLPENKHMIFIDLLQRMVLETEDSDMYCKLPENMMDWDDEYLKELAVIIGELDNNKQKDLISKTRKLFCTLNQ